MVLWGFIPYPYPFQLNSREVAEILLVPLDFLADDSALVQTFLPYQQPAISSLLHFLRQLPNLGGHRPPSQDLPRKKRR